MGALRNIGTTEEGTMARYDVTTTYGTHRIVATSYAEALFVGRLQYGKNFVEVTYVVGFGTLERM